MSETEAQIRILEKIRGFTNERWKDLLHISPAHFPLDFFMN